MHYPDPNPDGVRVLEIASGLMCPRCAQGPHGEALVHAAVGGERVLYCQRCRGLLVNMGVFLAVMEDLRSRRPGSDYTGKQPDWQDLKRRVACPNCGRAMDTHPYGGPGAVIIDTCSVCEANWLDYGELQQIVRAPDQRYVTLLDEEERRKIALGETESA
jgi:Zn-finger nucleic acid-binding protein